MKINENSFLLKKHILIRFVKHKKNNLNNKLEYKFLILAFIIFCLSIPFIFLFYSKVNTVKQIEAFNITQFFNTTIRSNSILIFEKNDFHYECTPGFAKYFLDLGFNVDIIMIKMGKETFIFFEPTKKLRFFILDDSKYYKSEEYIVKFRDIFNKYLAILVQTMTPDVKTFYSNANLLKGKNSIFVYHYYPEMPLIDFHNNNRSWTLLNFTNLALEVNPHYFGKIKFRDKNKITRFFIVSTGYRNYDQLISASNKLKNENLQFEIIVTGRNQALSEKIIPDNIKDKFLFRLHLSYFHLMNLIKNIDFIIITLTRTNRGDNTYINGRSTGSAQLAYGFLKPCIINKDFTKTYRMNNENSIIYSDLKDSLYFSMRNAIIMTNKEYKKKQYNLKKTADEIYEISKNNVKTTINYILKS